MINYLLIGSEELQELRGEFKQMIAEAISGNWIPIALVAALLTIIVILCIAVVRMHIKKNNERHERTEVMLQKLTESNLKLDRLVAMHDTDIETLKKQN